MVKQAVLAHRLFTGISRQHLACLAEELAVPWQAGLEGRRHAVRGGVRKRAAGAGARHQLVFVDRLVATLIHLRHDLPHPVPGLLFGVDRSTVTRAIGEVRTLLAERGCAVPDRPGLRLRTLTDVFAYAQAEGIELRLDATEIQVRRPPAGRGGRRAFVPGRKKQNTMKATVTADDQGRTLWTDALRPGRMHDATAARNEGIAICFPHFPDVEVLHAVVFDRLVLALVSGMGYERVADTACSATTIRRRRDEWIEAGVLGHLVLTVLWAYDRMMGLDLEDLAADSCITKAPSGGECAGKSPVDRGKRGLKRSQLTDGYGIPVVTVPAGANIRDHTLLPETLDEFAELTEHLDHAPQWAFGVDS